VREATVNDSLRKRLRQAGLAWGLLVALAGMLALLGLAYHRRQSPPAAPVPAVTSAPATPAPSAPAQQVGDLLPWTGAPPSIREGASLDHTGHWVACNDASASPGLWVLDTAGQDLYRLSTTAVENTSDWDRSAPRLSFSTPSTAGPEQAWLARPVGGHWRVSAAPPGMTPNGQLSPSGALLVVPDPGSPGGKESPGCTVLKTAPRRTLFRLPGSVSAWSPDEKTLYMVQQTARTAGTPAGTEVFAYSLPGGARKSVGKFRGEANVNFSPDGKWVAVEEWRKVTGVRWTTGLPVSCTLIRLRTGRRHVFPKWEAQDWPPGGRYLWCKSYTLEPPSTTAHVLDLRTLREVGTIGPRKLQGHAAYDEAFSPRGDWALINVHGPESIAPEGWHDIVLARANGTEPHSLQPFGIEPWGNAEVLGWTWDGDLLLFLEKERQLVRVDPTTGARTVIFPRQ
jgi:hypothetical protein